MNPLLSIIAALTALKTDLYTRFNSALKNVGPVEQVEASQQVIGVIREVDWAKDRIERIGTDLEATIANASKMISDFENRPGEAIDAAAARLIAAHEKKVGEEAVAAAITAGTILRKEDHEMALTAAKETAAAEAKTAAETEFNAKLKEIETLAARRKDAVTRLGEIAAASLTDEVLAGDKHEEAITAIEGRIAKLKEKDITAENRKDLFTNLIAKSSEEEVDSTLKLILDAAGGKLAPVSATTPDKKPTPPAAASGTGVGLNANNPDKKKVVI